MCLHLSNLYHGFQLFMSRFFPFPDKYTKMVPRDKDPGYTFADMVCNISTELQRADCGSSVGMLHIFTTPYLYAPPPHPPPLFSVEKRANLDCTPCRTEEFDEKNSPPPQKSRFPAGINFFWWVSPLFCSYTTIGFFLAI